VTRNKILISVVIVAAAAAAGYFRSRCSFKNNSATDVAQHTDSTNTRELAHYA